MNGSTIIFYIISAIILGGGLLAVTASRIFRAAIFLLISLIGIAGLYFWLDYNFIAAVQILVYVGGITVLIIFSIFLTHQMGSNMPKISFTRGLFSALLAIITCAVTILFISRYAFSPSVEQPVEHSIKVIGAQLLGTSQYGYALPFEAVSILLLAAMIGCIAIAIKLKPKE